MRLDRRLMNPRRVYPGSRSRQASGLPGGFRLWLGLGAAGLLGALGVLLAQLLLYARSLDRLPAGALVGGVPVAGLTRAEAEERLLDAYLSPLALDYQGSPIELQPAQIDFQIQARAMVAQIPIEQPAGSVWAAFWAHLWNRDPDPPPPVPLQAGYDQARLRQFLDDIASRYDEPGEAARPDPATLGFTGGSAGHRLDREAAFALLDAALLSPDQTARRLSLPVEEQAQAPLSFDVLAELLLADVGMFQFDGTLSLYLADLETGEALDLHVRNRQRFEPGPGIAYSGMSTIKIPVTVAYFRYREGELSADETLLLGGVFAESANAYTDLILGLTGGGNGLRGAELMTQTMGELGLPNTFLSGLLDTLGAVTGPRSTPANSRADLNLLPDPYNQTTATDMGRLLVMIHQCTQGAGLLMETFPEAYTPEECAAVIDFMRHNAVGPIFVSGGSPEADVAHKHGWDLLPLNNVGDAALVYSPGGEYALAIYANREEPVDFEYANRLLISLARAVYNYYNPQ
jgi:hypothetical protein